jgi:hypothetical protein
MLTKIRPDKAVDVDRHALNAPRMSRKIPVATIEGRTTRHPGYAVSERIRKRAEEAFGYRPPPAMARLRDDSPRRAPRCSGEFRCAA